MSMLPNTKILLEILQNRLIKIDKNNISLQNLIIISFHWYCHISNDDIPIELQLNILWMSYRLVE